MWRYIRAFFKALSMTIRGETPTTPAQRMYPRLFTWMEAAKAHIEAVYAAADAAAFGEEARKAIKVKIDGRESSFETLLATVRYHFNEEYPYMLRHLTEHSLTGIYASNINDSYWIETLAAHESVTKPVQSALHHLELYLKEVPPSNDLGAESQQTTETP
ncbi:MAG: hypothetical protein AAF125_10985 [Chloroflexota bacterium]